jgi:DNA-binding transcriptional LysR family regulator
MQDSEVDLDGLRSFLAVAERLNFNEAASLLGISAPALTRRVQRLEAALGLPLLERSTRQVSPTPHGLVFLPLAREALAAVDAAVEAVRAGARLRAGHLVLASVPTMTHQLLPRIIRAFHDRWPDIHVRVVECGAGAVEQAVRDGTADLGFSFLVGSLAADLAFDRILADAYCLVLPSGHALAVQDEVEWRDLKAQKTITAGRKSGNMKVLGQALRGVDWRPETEYEVDHLTTSLGLVEAGLGVAVLPRSALPARLSPGIAVRQLTNPTATRNLGIFRRQRRLLPLAARQLLSVAKRVAAGCSSKDPTNPRAGPASR